MTHKPKKYKAGSSRIEAMRFNGSNTALHAVYQWVEEGGSGSFDVNTPMEVVPRNGVSIDNVTGKMVISTSEGIVPVNVGDYVVKGPDGNFYPLRPDRFLRAFTEVK